MNMKHWVHPLPDTGMVLLPEVLWAHPGRGEWVDPRRLDYPQFAHLPASEHEARLLGAKTYWVGPGAACHRRHSAPVYVSTGKCTQCQRESTSAWRAANPEAAKRADTKPYEDRRKHASEAARRQAERKRCERDGLPVPEWAALRR